MSREHLSQFYVENCLSAESTESEKKGETETEERANAGKTSTNIGSIFIITCKCVCVIFTFPLLTKIFTLPFAPDLPHFEFQTLAHTHVLEMSQISECIAW